MGLFRALRDEFASTGATSNRTDTPGEPRRQTPTSVSRAQKVAAEHYRKTGDSSRMWAVKSAERDAEMARRRRR